MFAPSRAAVMRARPIVDVGIYVEGMRI